MKLQTTPLEKEWPSHSYVAIVRPYENIATYRLYPYLSIFKPCVLRTEDDNRKVIFIDDRYPESAIDIETLNKWILYPKWLVFLTDYKPEIIEKLVTIQEVLDCYTKMKE